MVLNLVDFFIILPIVKKNVHPEDNFYGPHGRHIKKKKTSQANSYRLKCSNSSVGVAKIQYNSCIPTYLLHIVPLHTRYG